MACPGDALAVFVFENPAAPPSPNRVLGFRVLEFRGLGFRVLGF